MSNLKFCFLQQFEKIFTNFAKKLEVGLLKNHSCKILIPNPYIPAGSK